MADAVALLHRNLEATDDADDTVSEQELTAHLRAMGAQAHRVVDWVTHGLQLPQYADAFRNHSITAVDLPHLVRDGGATLQEMGIGLALHRAKVSRGIKRLLLGLGSPPSVPHDLKCTPERGRVLVEWAPPANAGTPPMHKYVLERQVNQEWVSLPVQLTPDDTSTVDTPPESVVVYRLRAWNEYDRSEAAVSGQCAARPWNTLWCTLGILLVSVAARSAFLLGWLDKIGGKAKTPPAQPLVAQKAPQYVRMHSGLSSTSSHARLTHSASFGSTGSGERFMLPVGREPAEDDVFVADDKPNKQARCAHCDAKIYVPMIRIKVLGTHYCGVCQRYVCAAHTGVSPHGGAGDCGVESKCVCVGCLAEMDEGRRAEVLKRNRLGGSKRQLHS